MQTRIVSVCFPKSLYAICILHMCCPFLTLAPVMTLNEACMVQTADGQLRQEQKNMLYCCLTLLRPVLEMFMSMTYLRDELDLIANVTGTMIKVIQKSDQFDSRSEIIHDALACLSHLTTYPETRQQALQLLTAEQVEDLLSAALSWLEDDTRSEMEGSIATGKAIPP